MRVEREGKGDGLYMGGGGERRGERERGDEDGVRVWVERCVAA